MQTLYPPNDEGTGAPGDGDDDVLSQELKNNFDAVRTLLSSSSQQSEAAETMATKTAMQAHEEISRLQNGIAELEALLKQQEEQQQLQDNDVAMPPVVAFPSLVPVVVDEEEEQGVEDASSNHNREKGELVRSK